MIPQAVRRAAALVDAGRYDLARPEITRALADEPDDPTAMHVLALVEHGEGHHDRALAALDRATALGADTVAVLVTRMNIGYRTRRFPAAVAAGEEILRHRPDHLGAHVMLAQMLGTEGRADYHRARAHAEQAVALAPDDDHAHYALGSVLASPDGRRGPRDALPHLRTAVRLRPDSAVNLNALGLAELRLGRWRAAARSFASALAVDPQLEPAAFNLPLAMFGVLRRVGIVMFLVFVVAVVAASGLDAPPGAPWWARLVAVVVFLAVLAGLAARVDTVVPASVRPAARRALRRDPVLAPTAISSAILAALGLVVLAVPAPVELVAAPAFLLGALARVVGTLASAARTRSYGRDRREERAAVWRLVPTGPPHPPPVSPR